MERMLEMEKTLQELATLLKGEILQGDPGMVLKGVNGLEEAQNDQIPLRCLPIWKWPDSPGPGPS